MPANDARNKGGGSTMAPKVRPPKAWDSSKPPGGKLPPARKPKPST